MALVCAMGCSDSQPSTAADARSAAVVDADVADAVVDAGSGSRFLIRWTLAGGCLGGDEIETEISSRFDGRLFVKRFPCSAGSGLSDLVGEGDFDVLVRLIDNDIVVPPDSGPVPGPLLAQSDVGGPYQSIVDMTVDIDVAFPTNTASIASEWSFTANRQAQSCAVAGVASVDIEYEQMGGAIERQVRVPCGNAGDPSGDLPTGFYLVRATPVDDSGAPVFAQQEISVPLFVGNVGASAFFDFVVSAL